MKYLIAAIFIALTSVSIASTEKTGLGVMIGNPTGLTGKKWLSEDHAVDGGLGLSLGSHTNLSLHSDFLFHSFSAFYLNDTIPLDLYYGLGARMEFADEIELGARFPLGLVRTLEDKNADLFVEVAPVWDFLGRYGIELHFGAGARYYF